MDSFSLSSQYLCTFFLLQWSFFSGDEIRNDNAVSFSKNKFFSMACLLVEESDTEIENCNYSYHFPLVLCHCLLLLLIFFLPWKVSSLTSLKNTRQIPITKITDKAWLTNLTSIKNTTICLSVSFHFLFRLYKIWFIATWNLHYSHNWLVWSRTMLR